ncbi:hypothetical protein GCM10011342_08230 [Aquisalinus flavus]|uniref:Ion transport domain-containing protein n=1 Tax=Aquisalinus flavus TaxID=1526572 RepID=A0A8J2V5G1_9PROT|nr:ion transporter [Aquisalinus flavus]MBD0427510.1 ion transporter [Aquisalinus flavus]GGD01552.1 hypothetical protein GCM10011342_08230 [Aquisalinus flavus]
MPVTTGGKRPQAQLDLAPEENAPPRHILRLRNVINARPFQYAILILIFANAALLGLETLPPIRENHLALFLAIDRAFLVVFLGELAVRIYAWRQRFFRDGWNVFDFVIILISALATSNLFAALRAFRVLRVLHVVTMIPRMRTVVRSLIDSIPGILSVGVIVVLIVYVFAVIASNLYGAAHPVLFGDVFVSMYTLFQVMTLEGWAEIANTVAGTHPNSWIFFITFVLIGTFTMLNLFVAIVVRVVEEDSEHTEDLLVKETDEVQLEVQALRREIRTLTALVETIEARGREPDGKAE